MVNNCPFWNYDTVRWTGRDFVAKVDTLYIKVLVFKRKKDLVSKGTVVLRRLGVKPHNDLALSTEFMVSITTIKKLCNLLTMAN